jgi:hypothetical protein
VSTDRFVDWASPAPYLSGLAAAGLRQRLGYRIDLWLTQHRAAVARKHAFRDDRRLRLAARHMPLHMRRDIGLE